LTMTEEKGPHQSYYQMKRVDLYKKFIAELLKEGKAYPCYCTKDEIEAMRRLAQLEKRPPRYNGRCRTLTEKQKSDFKTEGKPFSIRFRMPEEGITIVEIGRASCR